MSRKKRNPKRTISVIIVNYNVKAYLENCIVSLNSSHVTGDREIIVVDNDSFDGSVQMLESRFPKVKVVQNETNIGFAAAVNRGVEVATGNLILVLNPDTIVQEDTLNVLAEYMEDHPHVGICGPKILNADGTLQLSCKRSFPTPGVALPKILGLSKVFPKNRWAGKYNLSYLDPDEVHRVDAISGSCMLIRRELFERVGAFDDRFFMFGEDLDLCYRATQGGYEVHYVPLTQIVHYKGESVKVSPYDSLKWFHEAMTLFLDIHFSRTVSFVTRSVLRVGILARHASMFVSSSMAQFVPVVMDVGVVILSFLAAIPLRFGDLTPLFEAYLPVLVIYSVFWILVGSAFQLYSRFVLSYNRAMVSSILAFLFITAFTYFFKQIAYSRAVVLIASALVTLGIPGWRLLAHVLKSRGFFRSALVGQSSIFSRRAVIIGSGKEGKRIAGNIARRLDTGIYVVGFSDSDYGAYQSENGSPSRDGKSDVLPPFLGTLDSIREIVKSHSVRELIFTSDRLTNEVILGVMDTTKDMRLTYRIVPKERDIILGKALVEDVSDFPFVNIEYTLFRRLNALSKRTFDLILASLMLILLSPVLLLLLIKYPRWEKTVFWGVDESRFKGWVTPSKRRFFRELPLLLPIFRGDMSFVGSSLIPVSSRKVQLVCRPGLTGLDRIKKLHIDTDERTVLEHYYVQHQSMVFDLEILVRTLFAL